MDSIKQYNPLYDGPEFVFMIPELESSIACANYLHLPRQSPVDTSSA